MNAPSPHDVVIVSAARTPFGRFKGSLASLTAVELGTVAARSAIERAVGLDASDIELVSFGQVLQAAAGQNPARQVGVAAGIPLTSPAVTINKVCLSGLTAIIDAARMIGTGECAVALAGGQESMTNAPHALVASRQGLAYGDVTLVDTVSRDGLTDAFDGRAMGLATESDNLGSGHITRVEQDEIAALSHHRAAEARTSGGFTVEIAPVVVTGSRGATTTVLEDEGIRPDTTIETLARLRPAFTPDGTITAGNASQLTDGAAAVILTTRTRAASMGAEILATVRAWGQVGGPDTSLLAQPYRAIRAALARQGWSVADLDHIEINEAFAAVVAFSSRELGVSNDKVNPQGGGISLGHPIGASGARLVVHAVHALRARGGGRAAVALCGGGGQGEALLLEV
ncbi:acetyl-CoA C-acetyltransferase [Herbiconiux daphne]|uniref:Probable acetyl-CoA acetyltransferase n=1 Tax=Herbiconiux daphne TaxID=2970914 RepID=A0ABT2H770_9MICO|nr:acetyl-CoA C-acetyltransferase [Herbiconiux daphne]MCS5735754.1 acetyl-CoA C-acetyltransferase [Herbiconiux daphne]